MGEVKGGGVENMGRGEIYNFNESNREIEGRMLG